MIREFHHFWWEFQWTNLIIILDGCNRSWTFFSCFCCVLPSPGLYVPKIYWNIKFIWKNLTIKRINEIKTHKTHLFPIFLVHCFFCLCFVAHRFSMNHHEFHLIQQQLNAQYGGVLKKKIISTSGKLILILNIYNYIVIII